MGWGWFEAGWVRLRTLDVSLPGLPPALAGLRIAHLSDFHLGLPSRGTHAVGRAFEWVRERDPELVLVTAFVVLGNHDVEHSRDPFSRAAGLTDLAPARLLVDESETIDVRGHRVQIVGVDPRAYREGTSKPWALLDEAAELRILLCHFPYVLDFLPPGAFDLVLAGHMHDGQISLPLGRNRKYRFAHPHMRYATGLYRRPGGTMHVSPGLGTTFVPFRFFARPEATELVLQREPE